MSAWGGHLTRRHCDVLRLSATGPMSVEVAVYFDHPSDIVRADLAACGAKLGARSKLDAVMLDLRAELIDVGAL